MLSCIKPSAWTKDVQYDEVFTLSYLCSPLTCSLPHSPCQSDLPYQTTPLTCTCSCWDRTSCEREEQEAFVQLDRLALTNVTGLHSKSSSLNGNKVLLYIPLLLYRSIFLLSSIFTPDAMNEVFNVCLNPYSSISQRLHSFLESYKHNPRCH